MRAVLELDVAVAAVVDFVGAEGAVEGEVGFALGFEVGGVVVLSVELVRDSDLATGSELAYLAGPLFVPSLALISLTHEVTALVVVVGPSHTIFLTRRYIRHTIQGLMPLDSVLNILGRRRLQCLAVALVQRIQRCSFRIPIPRQQRRIIRTFVMVSTAANGRVQTVDLVGPWEGLLVQVRRAAGFLRVLSDDVERLMAFIAWVALAERAASAAARSAWCVIAGGGFAVRGRRALAVCPTARRLCTTKSVCTIVWKTFFGTAAASADGCACSALSRRTIAVWVARRPLVRR